MIEGLFYILSIPIQILGLYNPKSAEDQLLEMEHEAKKNYSKDKSNNKNEIHDWV